MPSGYRWWRWADMAGRSFFPFSDVDVLLLLPEGAAGHGQRTEPACIEGFIGSCWDAGLEIGSSVRTTPECLPESAADVTVQTSLLEARLICGNAALFAHFQGQYQAQMDPKAFLVAKTLEMRQRHTKYDNTPYALEPNCKESPGGLRDLQLILWVAKAAGLGGSWKELAASGMATPFEVRQIERNEALFCLIRARLHQAAGRHEDRLGSTCKPRWRNRLATVASTRWLCVCRCAPAKP